MAIAWGPNKKTGSGVSFYAILDWNLIEDTTTYVTYTFRSGMYISAGQSPEFNGWANLNYNGTTYSGTGGTKGYGGSNRWLTSTYTQTWYKTSTAQTKTISFAARKNSDSSSYQSNGSLSISIPALQLPVISNFTASRDSEEYNKINYEFDISTLVGEKSKIYWYIDGVENGPKEFSDGHFNESITLGGTEVTPASIAKNHTLKLKAVDNTNPDLVKESETITIPEILAPTITKVTIARDTNNQNIVEVDYEIAKIKEDQVTVVIECDLSESWKKTKNYTSNITSEEIKDSVTFDNHGASASTITVTVKGLTDKGESKTYKVSPSFYTMDFGAKGKSIAMGVIAKDDVTEHPDGLFQCAMDAEFIGALNILPVGATYSVYDENTNPNDFLYGTWELQEKLVSTKGLLNLKSLNNTYFGSTSPSSSPYSGQRWSVNKNMLSVSAGFICSSWPSDEYHYATIPIKINESYRFWNCGGSTGGAVPHKFILEQHTDGNIAVCMKKSGGSSAWSAASFTIDLSPYTWNITDSNVQYYTEYVWVRTA